MTPTKMIVGLVVAGSMMSFGPIAIAMPVTGAQTVQMGTTAEKPVVQVVTRAGVAHRSTRRTARRVGRR